jgi:hypothetical protein
VVSSSSLLSAVVVADCGDDRDAEVSEFCWRAGGLDGGIVCDS